MIEKIQADLVALTIVIMLLIDVNRNRTFVESRQEKLFRYGLSASIVMVVLSIIRGVFSVLDLETIQPDELLHMLHLLATGAAIIVWSRYALVSTACRCMPLKKRVILVVFLTVIAITITVVDKAWYRPYLFGVSTVVLLQSIICVSIRRKTMQRLHWNTLWFWLLGLLVSLMLLWMFDHRLLLDVVVSVGPMAMLHILQNRQLSYDSLTQLRNRSLFMRHTGKILELGGKGSVIVADLVNFKYFNQRFGQLGGDALLKAVGSFFAVNTPGRMAYRYGPDQFAIVLGKKELDKTQAVARIINERFESSWDIGFASTKISVNMAIVMYPQQAKNAEELVNAIDLTLYYTKADRLASPVVYQKSFLEQHQRKQAIRQALLRALENRRILLHYQPVFDVKTSSIIAGEALLRIDDPELGLLFPDSFIRIAEETALIVEITYIIVQEVCDFLKRTSLDIPISINLSAIHFLQPMMEKRIARIIRSNDIAFSSFTFELTESMVVDSYDRVKEVMDYLMKLGSSFALDDYGKGYSNIESLASLPCQTVKLDRSIVEQYETNPTLIESIVYMLKHIGKTIVAEGVETQAQLEACTRYDVDCVQGFLFAKPMGEHEFLAYYRDQTENHRG